jgi:hypothetical protein
MIQTDPLYFSIKTGILVAIFALLQDWKLATGVSLVLIVSYQYVIAAIYGVIVIPSMDLGTFFSEDKAPLNIISSIMMSNRPGRDEIQHLYRKSIHMHPKMRSEIKMILGDPYYAPIKGNHEDIIQSQVSMLKPGKLKTQE